MARETVAKRLAAASVAPAGTRHGHPVYRIRQAAEALLDPAMRAEDGDIDPKRLAPMDRNAWYQSEIRRLDLEMKCGQLLPAAEFEAEAARVVKTLVQFLETLGDQLERDVALSPEQVDAVNTAVSRQRAQLYELLTQEEDVRERA